MLMPQRHSEASKTDSSENIKTCKKDHFKQAASKNIQD